MRLVLDQGIPRDAAVRLRDHGHDCVHVGEVGMHNAADDEILAWSATGAILVTIDADFHAILAVSGASTPSVIRLRIQGLRAPEVTSLIERVIGEFQTDLQRGCLITVKSHKTTPPTTHRGSILEGSRGRLWR